MASSIVLGRARRGVLEFGPVVGGAVAYGVYRLFYIQAKIYNVDVDLLVVDRIEQLDTLATLDPVLGRLSWGVTGTAFVLSFIGAVIVLGGLLLEDLQARSRASRRGILLMTVVVVIAVGWSSLWDNPFTVKSLNPVLLRTFEVFEMGQAGLLLAIFTPMILAVTFLLMLAAWASLARTRTAGEKPEMHLRNQMRHLNTALFVGATILVAGIVWAIAMHRLPSALLDDIGAETLDELIHGLSTSMGAIWSLILVGIYLPSIWLVRARVRQLALDSLGENGKTPKQVSEWLAENGLSAQLSQRFAQLAALLGPLIIGGPAAPLLQLLTG